MFGGAGNTIQKGRKAGELLGREGLERGRECLAVRTVGSQRSAGQPWLRVSVAIGFAFPMVGRGWEPFHSAHKPDRHCTATSMLIGHIFKTVGCVKN